MADSPVAAYIVKQSNGQFKLAGTPYGAAPYGIAIPKDTAGSRAVLAAMKELIADGTYTQILNKWGVEAGAITDPGINGAIELGRCHERAPQSDPRRSAGPRRSRPSRSGIPALGRGRDRRVLIARRSSARSSPTRASSGTSSATTSSTARVLHGAGADARADRLVDGHRHRARRRARGDAALAEPARLGRAAGSTSGSSAARRCSCSCSSGTSSRRSIRDRRSASRSAPAFVSRDANTLITPFVAAILGLGLNEGAYMAEIVRAGILSVDEGQTEAAQSRSA